jgi:hypothetical protein
MIAATERTGHDFEFEFLSEAEFGGVITVEGHVFEDSEKIAVELGVSGAGECAIATAVGFVDPVDRIIERTEERGLL